jgi:hypothetical protein
MAGWGRRGKGRVFFGRNSELEGGFVGMGWFMNQDGMSSELRRSAVHDSLFSAALRVLLDIDEDGS